MRPLHLIFSLLLVAPWASAGSTTASAEESIRLMGTIVGWRYPDAEIGKAEMADAATMDADGKRTVLSLVMKTTMVTPDPVDKVLAFYQVLLTRIAANDKKRGIAPDAGESVVFSDESEGRPFAFHTILVNSEKASTTLIVTRGQEEEQTHSTWKRYLKQEALR